MCSFTSENLHHSPRLWIYRSYVGSRGANIFFSSFSLLIQWFSLLFIWSFFRQLQCKIYLYYRYCKTRFKQQLTLWGAEHSYWEYADINDWHRHLKTKFFENMKELHFTHIINGSHRYLKTNLFENMKERHFTRIINWVF